MPRKIPFSLFATFNYEDESGHWDSTIKILCSQRSFEDLSSDNLFFRRPDIPSVQPVGTAISLPILSREERIIDWTRR